MGWPHFAQLSKSSTTSILGELTPLAAKYRRCNNNAPHSFTRQSGNFSGKLHRCSNRSLLTLSVHANKNGSCVPQLGRSAASRVSDRKSTRLNSSHLGI